MGGDLRQIARTLLNALIAMPGFDLVYVWLDDPNDGPGVEMVRLAAPLEQALEPQEFGKALQVALGDVPSKWSSNASIRIQGCHLSVAPTRMGLHGDLGVVVAGSQRSEFPGQTETLLLNVAVNQAIIALQDARRPEQPEERRRGGERTCAPQHMSLPTTNEGLKREMAEGADRRKRRSTKSGRNSRT